MVILTGLFILTIAMAPDQIGAFMAGFIIAYLFSTAAYIGGNVWAAYIKSKYFQPELHNQEKPLENIGG